MSHTASIEIKVVCLNLWHGGLLFEEILDFLKTQAADILLLQEVYAGTETLLPMNYRSIEVLKQRLDYQYFNFAAAMIDKVPEGKVESGNAVFSKFPIISSTAVPLYGAYSERDAFDPLQIPTTPRNLQRVTVEADGIPINLCNFQGVWDLDGDNYSPQRQHMSEVIINTIKGLPNVILAGDTNAKPTNKAMLAIEDHLTSVFGNELQTSFNMRRKDNPGYATACVDMIFVSPNIEVLEKSCPDVDISDHLPLVTTLQI